MLAQAATGSASPADDAAALLDALRDAGPGRRRAHACSPRDLPEPARAPARRRGRARSALRRRADCAGTPAAGRCAAGGAARVLRHRRRPARRRRRGRAGPGRRRAGATRTLDRPGHARPTLVGAGLPAADVGRPRAVAAADGGRRGPRRTPAPARSGRAPVDLRGPGRHATGRPRCSPPVYAQRRLAAPAGRPCATASRWSGRWSARGRPLPALPRPAPRATATRPGRRSPRSCHRPDPAEPCAAATAARRRRRTPPARCWPTSTAARRRRSARTVEISGAGPRRAGAAGRRTRRCGCARPAARLTSAHVGPPVTQPSGRGRP